MGQSRYKKLKKKGTQNPFEKQHTSLRWKDRLSFTILSKINKISKFKPSSVAI